MRRHQWHLNDDQHANLMHYLVDYPVLQQLYPAKQRLVRLMLLETLTAAERGPNYPGYSNCWSDCETAHHGPWQRL